MRLRFAVLMLAFVWVGSAQATVTLIAELSDFDFTPVFFDADVDTLDPLVSTDPLNAVTLTNANQGDTHAFRDFVTTANELALGTLGLPPFDTRDYGLGSGDTNFDVAFATQQTVFAGLFLDTSVPTEFDLTFFSGGTEVGSFVVPALPPALIDVAPNPFDPAAPFDVAVQIGFVSDIPFDLVEVRENGRDPANREHFWLFLGTPVAAPAPATALLFGAGLIGLRLLRRRR